MMFASAFYLYLGPRKSDEFGFHDDGAPSAFGTFPYTIYNLILLGFVGEFDPDNFDEVAVRVLLVFFILVVMIVFLNVLIAIVSDSYDLSMAKAEGLFLRSRCELITETALIASLLPTRCLPTHDEATIKASLALALRRATRAADDDPNRLNYTINAVAAIVDNRTQKLEAELSQTRQELAEMKAMLQVLVDKGEERHGLLRRLID